MSADKYPSIFSRQMATIVYIFPNFENCARCENAKLSENCSLLGTDNVQGQISEHIFAPNGDYCLYINTLQSARGPVTNGFYHVSVRR